MTQTASVKSPYIYAEDNWIDDMELANAYVLSKDNMPVHKEIIKKTLMDYANAEPITPGLVQIQLNITNGIPLLILDIMSWPNNYKENREILSLVITKKAFNGFGTKPNQMLLPRYSFHLVQ